MSLVNPIKIPWNHHFPRVFLWFSTGSWLTLHDVPIAPGPETASPQKESPHCCQPVPSWSAWTRWWCHPRSCKVIYPIDKWYPKICQTFIERLVLRCFGAIHGLQSCSLDKAFDAMSCTLLPQDIAETSCRGELIHAKLCDLLQHLDRHKTFQIVSAFGHWGHLGQMFRWIGISHI